MRILNVAEKPSVAREISKILSVTPIKFLLRGVEAFKFTYSFEGISCDMIFTSVRGHIMEIDFGSDYKNWGKSNPFDLFSADIFSSVKSDCQNIYSNLKELSASSDILVIWTDYDREGEAIGFEIIDICLLSNSRIKVKRAQFSALTRDDIASALRRITIPNFHMAQAVLARSEIDLRAGAAFTRFLTLRYADKLKQNSFDIKFVSYGPCQFATLSLITERFERINAFVSEPFWIFTLEIPESLPVSSAKERIFDLAIAIRDYNDMAARLLSNGGFFKITSITNEPKIKKRPFPLNTINLTKLASSKLHIDSSTCMSLAESLYNRGFISYPRTETEVYHSSINTLELLQRQSDSSGFGRYARELITSGGYQRPREGLRDDKAHPPIHPVKIGNPSEMTFGEWKLFELLARHFIATCSPDASAVTTRIDLSLDQNNVAEFYIEGVSNIQANWLTVFHYERWNTHEIILPESWRIGTLIAAKSFTVTESKTVPPSLLSEAELISQMDSHGIGTDATMHEHIKNVQIRGYVDKTESRLFSPTPLGLALIRGLREYGEASSISSVSLRSTMERELELIARGIDRKSDFIARHAAGLKTIYSLICNSPTPLDGHVLLLCTRPLSVAPGPVSAQDNPSRRYNRTSARRGRNSR